MNIFQEFDNNIFFKRQNGYSPRDILKTMQGNEPCLDDLLLLNHLARVCSGKGLPFSQKQIKRLFNEVHRFEFHGNKAEAWTFLKTFCSKKLIIFKSENTKKAVPSQKVPSVTHKVEEIKLTTARLLKIPVIGQANEIQGVLA